MLKETEKTAKTVDLAVAAACEALGVSADEVDVTVIESCLREMLVVEQSLPLANHSENVVVDNELDYRDIVRVSRDKLVQVHRKAAVARDVDHGFVGAADLSAE